MTKTRMDVADLNREVRRALFARIGWMTFYNGRQPYDVRPIGGGAFNEDNVGSELNNFQEVDGRFYSYFQPPTQPEKVNLKRIDRYAANESRLEHVLVIFVARRPEGGQVIVGWYNNSTVLRHRADRPKELEGHGYLCSAERQNCILLPRDARGYLVPHGSGGLGQANVCYVLNADGSAKKADWIHAALEFVDNYKGANIVKS